MDEAAPDEVLVEHARRGDRDAFGLLVRRHQDAVFRVVARTSRVDRARAEDLAQETFLRAWQALDRFRGECSFLHWVFRIAANLTVNRSTTLAAQAERRAVSIDGTGVDGRNPEHATRMEPEDRRQEAPSGRMERQELADVLEQALAGLPDEFRMAVVLRDVEGLEYDEIASALEVPIGTVRSRIHRGRERLRELLGRLSGAARSGIEGRAGGAA